MELSELQKEILNAPYNKIIVFSSAASGKTRLLTEKVRQLLRAGVDPREIAVITFTNMAAGELRQRLGEDYKNGLFIGTIHSLANHFLVTSGISTKTLLKEENFDELFPLVKQHPECIKHIEYLLLDEAQDTDKLQFEFLLDMINPPSFFLCGDARQSIYGFRGSRPDILLKLTRREDVKTFDMNENYRNGYNILNFAKSLIKPTGLLDTSRPMRSNNGSVMELQYDISYIADKIKEDRNYGNWAILTRTNAQISSVISTLMRYGIPYDTFKQKDLTKETLNLRMSQNTVKVLTVHSAKGLEWENVVVLGMLYGSDEERRVCYVAATRAKDNLFWLRGRRRR